MQFPPACRRFFFSSACAFFLGASAAFSSQPPLHDVPFSVLAPNADRVHLLGDFNGWKPSEDSLMARDPSGRWLKSVALPDGTNAYAFFAEGPSVSGDGWLLDWKSSRVFSKKRSKSHSLLVLPDDLDSFLARQAPARETERGIEIPVFYERISDATAALSPNRYSSDSLSPSPPPFGNWSLPEFVGKDPLFGIVSVGDLEFLAAFDRQSPGDKTYNRLVFDLNRNGDLTDDEPLPGDVSSYNRQNYFSCAFPPIDLQIDVDGQTLPYCLRLRIAGSIAPNLEMDSSPSPQIYLSVLAHCVYLGEFALDGAGFRFALADASGNGVFGDAPVVNPGSRYADGALFAGGDLFVLAPSGQPLKSADGVAFGRNVAVGQRLFEIQLDLAAGSLVLRPLESGIGFLSPSSPILSMSMLAPASNDSLMVFSGDAPIPAPAGNWRLLEYRMLKKDDWGDVWFLHGRGASDVSHLPVRDGETIPLPFGEPLKASVAIGDHSLRRTATQDLLRISMSLLGNAGERIADLRRFSGNLSQHKMSSRSQNRPEEATFRIVKPDGELVFSGSFEYG